MKESVKKIATTFSMVVLAGFSAFSLGNKVIQAQAAASQCVITLFGIQYDVTTLQNSHTGGNIFACGTDMTAIYSAQHGTDVSRMAPFVMPTATATPTMVPSATPTVIPTTSPSPTAIPSPSTTVTPSPTSGGKHDDDENEDRDHDEQENEGNEHDRNEVEFHFKLDGKQGRLNGEIRNHRD